MLTSGLVLARDERPSRVVLNYTKTFCIALMESIELLLYCTDVPVMEIYWFAATFVKQVRT